MKNKGFWGLVAVVVSILVLLVWAAIGGLKDLGLTDPAAAGCSLAFLLVAFVAWEFLMKPGYGRLHRSEVDVPPGDDKDEPPSPGSP